MIDQKWVLFIPQIPPSPSSLRVMIWRRLQQAGAVSLHTGTWVLPLSPAHETFMQTLLATIQQQGGGGFVFRAEALNEPLQVQTLERFRQNRAQEYQEFEERCQEFLQEIKKETTVNKFTFAELEENEHDLLKLTSWLRKIQQRDFFEGQHGTDAEKQLHACRLALRSFTACVYQHAGLVCPEEDDEAINLGDTPGFPSAPVIP